MEDAVAAAGARPLTRDDPSRDQLIALAKTGLTHRIVAQAQTPRSPVPRATPCRTDGEGRAQSAGARARSALVLVAAGFLGAKMIADSRSDRDSASPT